jgi:predicted nucleotidyltransferase/SAM-dependent methyltransferase
MNETTKDRLLGTKEAAAFYGVSVPNFCRDWASRPDFPAPAATLARGRVWRAADLLAYRAVAAPRRGARTGRLRLSPQAEKWLPVIKRRIVRGFEPQRIILFGSQARDDARSGSDVDLVVVMSGVASSRDTRTAIYGALHGIPLAVDVLVVTPEQLVEYAGLIGTVSRPAVREGVTIYASDKGEVRSSAMSIDGAPRARRQIADLAAGFRQAQVLFTCVELGVFDALAAGASTPSDIAAATATDPRAVELLLNAATALGLLVKDGGRFRIREEAEPLLTRAAPASMVRGLEREAQFYRRWANLADAVRTGLRPVANTEDETPPEWIERFVQGLYAAAKPFAPLIAASLDLPRDRDLRLIDVGGCHGAYSMALAERYPRLEAVVYELPRVVPVARRLIADAGWSDRVRVVEGDFQREGLRLGYDVALVFGVLNGEPPAGRPALIRKVFDALAPGGSIVLRDAVLDPDRAGPPEATLFALQMLLSTDGGGLDTRADWDRWLAEAGFEPPVEIELPPEARGPLVVARKPGGDNAVR